MKALKLSTILLVAFVLLLGRTSAAAENKLVVWHTWSPEELKVVQAYTDQNYKGAVEWKAFESPQALYAAVLNAPESERPDVFTGLHTWGDTLAQKGIVGAYCTDEQPCLVCSQPNPPRWCLYALGKVDKIGIVPEFAIGADSAFADDFRCGNEPRPIRRSRSSVIWSSPSLTQKLTSSRGHSASYQFQSSQVGVFAVVSRSTSWCV